MLESDNPKVLELIAEARGGSLSPEERAERGFIQGTVNEGLLEAALTGPRIYLAVSGDEVTGFVMSWSPEQIGEQNRVGSESLRLAAQASARDDALAVAYQCAVQRFAPDRRGFKFRSGASDPDSCDYRSQAMPSLSPSIFGR